jgi:transcriptional regulator with XRE-family HTH domain
MSIRNQRQFYEVTRKVWGQLFGIFMRKARQNSCLPMEAIALLAGMSTTEWLAVESGNVPDPAQLKSMAAALGMGPEQMGTVVQICRGAWEQ